MTTLTNSAVWSAIGFWSKVKWRVSCKVRHKWLSEHLGYAKFKIDRRLEYIMEGINKMKSVDETDTRDNLHNVRKDLRSLTEYLDSRLAKELMDSKTKREAYEITDSALSMVNDIGYAAFVASLDRLDNRGYFAYETKLASRRTPEEAAVGPI